MASNNNDYKEELNEKIASKLKDMIEKIENDNSLEFSIPWNNINEYPYNPVTGTQYSGINFWSLVSQDHPDNRYFTFKQVRDIENTRRSNWEKLNNIEENYKNKKISEADYISSKDNIEQSFLKLESLGLADRTKPIFVKSKGPTPIYIATSFNFTVDKEEHTSDDTIETTKIDKKLIRYKYVGSVFNGSQIENLKPYEFIPNYEYQPQKSFEDLLKAMEEKTGLKVIHGGNKAYYTLNSHEVHLPLATQFKNQTDYMDVATHELGHSTGKALGRDMSGKFGSPKYAFEELVAELTSQHMGMSLGIEHTSNHENRLAYLKTWYKAMQEDKTLFFKAASLAQQSADFQLKILNEYRLEQAQSAEAKLKTSIPKKHSAKAALKL